MYLIHECHSPSAKPQALSGCHQRLQLFLQVTQCNAQHLRFFFSGWELELMQCWGGGGEAVNHFWQG
jgi:hypothetical protein